MKKIIKTILGLILICFIGIGIFFAGSHYADTHNKTEITSSMIESRLEDADDLVTTKYYYTHIGKYQNSLSLNGWKIPLTQKNFLLQFDGEIHAGIDLSQVEVNVKGNEIIVNTPKIKVISNSIDESSIQIYDEDNNIFNPIKVSDYKKFAVQQKKLALKEAKKKGMMKKASTSAKKTIKNLINTIPDVKDNYTITIHIGAVQ